MAAAQPKDWIKNVVSALWLVDSLVGVFCIAAAIDIGFAPGRVATFESGTLALVIIFLSLLIILAAIAPGFLIHTWLRALERFVGKGVLYVLIGILVSSPTVVWRLIPAGITVALGFAYILFSVFQRSMHPRPLLAAGTGEAAGAGGSGGATGAAAGAAAGAAPGAAAAGRSSGGQDSLFVRAPDAPPPAPAPKRSHNPFLNPPGPEEQ